MLLCSAALLTHLKPGFQKFAVTFTFLPGRQVSLEAKEAELFDAHAQHAWFSSDHRLGQLCLTMEPMGCFMAEDYAQVGLGRMTTLGTQGSAVDGEKDYT